MERLKQKGRDLMKSAVLIAFSLCYCLPGCAPNMEPDGDEIVNKNEKSGSVVKAVIKLSEISKSFGGNHGSQLQEEQIVKALKLGGSTKNYFSIDDFVNILADYDRRFGRDEFFYDAARLAYSYSDGEYAGRFEKQFPELVKISIARFCPTKSADKFRIKFVGIKNSINS